MSSKGSYANKLAAGDRAAGSPLSSDGAEPTCRTEEHAEYHGAVVEVGYGSPVSL